MDHEKAQMTEMDHALKLILEIENYNFEAFDIS
jgi:hypothetical protein